MPLRLLYLIFVRVRGWLVLLGRGELVDRLGDVIARIWRGATRLEDAEEYVRYIESTGLAA